MDEKYVAEREIARSRARMTDLAVELSRRASPTYVREHAKEMAKDKAMAMREHAKEKAMAKSMEWKEQASHSNKPFGLLGAVAGWVLGSSAFKMYQKRHADGYRSSSMGYGSQTQGWSDQGWNGGQTYVGAESIGSDYTADYSSPAYGTQAGTADLDIDVVLSDSSGDKPSLKEKAGEKLGALKEKAVEMKGNVRDRSSDMSGSVKGRAHDLAGSVRERSQHLVGSTRERSMHARENVQEWYGRSINEQPWILMLGAMAIGSLAAYLLPVTNPEHRVLSPAKSRVREQIQKVSGAVEEKISGGSNEESQTASSGYDVSETSNPTYGASETTGASYSASAESSYVASSTESGYLGSPTESTSNLGASGSSDTNSAPKSDGPQDLKTVH